MVRFDTGLAAICSVGEQISRQLSLTPRSPIVLL